MVTYYDDPDSQTFETEGLEAAATIPDSGEGGKLKMLVSLLKRCLGVKDIAAIRLSLPASLLEPLPNLEYWQYLDRPDLFAAINDSEDPFFRMLAVIRFTFSKELKFIRGKICKPYNSVLGEYFRAHWDVIPVSYSADPSDPPKQHLYISLPADSSKVDITTVKSAQSSRLSVLGNGNKAKNAETLSIKSNASGGAKSAGKSSPVPQTLIGETNLDAGISSLSLTDSVLDAETGELIETDVYDGDRIRVVYLTEQVSHHPPISTFHVACPAKHLTASGVDQIAARVSGTTVRVAPGAHNKGIFIKISGGPGAGETYRITHPTAQVNGILRGSFYATVSDSTFITVSGSKSGVKYRTVLEYKDESWLGKPQFAVEGVIHTVVEGDNAHESWAKVRHVPKDRVVAEFEGSWKHHIRWKRAGETKWRTLLDLSTLHVIPKAIRPLSAQQPNESQKLWEHVTSNLLKNEYGEATKYKLAIEQRQRNLAADRKKKGVEFDPVFFERNFESGEASLTPVGKRTVEEELTRVDEP
ncbi:hypothetical protein BU17DRAFT_75541 [Hysterangium stoloniferum]|nr:hypothetical protein BU17DRAFT_75541 [Hysterangium stoloniferum]